MNKSLNYIKNRLTKGDCLNMPIEDFKEMNVIPFYTVVDDEHKDYTIIATDKDNKKVLADLIYAPDAEFNYFITETCVCDGTLIFIYELIGNILKLIMSLRTSHRLIFEKEFSQKEFDNGNCIIHYEVGDFVINSQIIESPDKSKPWLTNDITVMLPVKYSIEKIKN